MKEYYIDNSGALVDIETKHIVVGRPSGVFVLAADIIALNTKQNLSKGGLS